jgi:predicted permease
MPALSAVVIISLSLGIGVNTVVFSWIQARVLEPIPGAPQGASVLLIEARTEAGLYNGSSWPEYRDLKDSLTVFDDVFAARMVPLYVGEPGTIERASGLLVSDNYFTALRVQPARGRFLRSDDASAPGQEPVAVISHRLWQARFQGVDVLNKTLRINGRQVTIVGVTPAEFQGTTVGLQFDAWLPAIFGPLMTNGAMNLEDRSVRGYTVMGRLKPEARKAQAQIEVDGVMRRLAETYSTTNTKVRAEVLPFSDSPRGPQRLFNSALFILQAIMLVLLLAVCGNVANLLLARASARQKEMAIRLTLGAGRLRVVRLLFAENLILALFGSGLGAIMAVWGTKALMLMPMVSGLPLRFQTSIDGLALGFAVLLGLISSLLFGLAPALHLARVEPQLVSRVAAKGSGRNRLRQTLMATQVALATVVLVVASMFFKSFRETRTVDPGFRLKGVLLAAYDGSARGADAAFSRSLAARTLDRIGALGSVQGVAISASVPLDIHGLPSRVFSLEGRARTSDGDDEALTNLVTPGYFAVMDIALLKGRDFSALLDARAPKEAIVNDEFVRRYVGAGEPLGRQLSARGGPFTIVGVVATSLYNAFGEPKTPAIYFSYKDNPQPRGEIHARAKGISEASLSTDLRAVMREIDPELAVFNLRSMGQQIDTNLIFRKIPAQMFSVLGPLLLILCATGIYAVVAYGVALRTREIGVRLALGATSRRVVLFFVAESFKVAALGAIIGWGIVLGLTLKFAPVGSFNGVLFAAVPLLLLGVAAVACWIPARRVALVEAALSLRSE